MYPEQCCISQSLNKSRHSNDIFCLPLPTLNLLNGNLQTEQNKDFILIKTEGKVHFNAMIFIDGESCYMENSKAGEF
jgi:hypothetical protein